MKVKYECDFCGAKYSHLYPINDGAWAICKMCMDLTYGECTCDEELAMRHLSHCVLDGEEE